MSFASQDPTRPISERVADLLSRMTLQEKINQMSVRMASGEEPATAARVNNAMQADAIAKSRLGIPMLLTRETSHGLNTVGVTSFPACIAMASSWMRIELSRRPSDRRRSASAGSAPGTFAGARHRARSALGTDGRRTRRRYAALLSDRCRVHSRVAGKRSEGRHRRHAKTFRRLRPPVKAGRTTTRSASPSAICMRPIARPSRQR